MNTFKSLKFLVLVVIIVYQMGITRRALASDFAFKGYITNKLYNPLKLKVFEIGKEPFYLSERNLEDNSYIPHLNLKVVAENTLDYSLTVGQTSVFIPELTKLTGYISEIKPPKKFNRRGYFKVIFDKAVCPNGKVIDLDSNITLASHTTTYNPLRHIGETALGLVGGSLLGALFSYQLGGLGLAIATQGYSLAAGAGVGGFLGTVGGFTDSGKNSFIEPGTELTIAPIDDSSVIQLKQIACKKSEIVQTKKSIENEKIKIEIISVKRKKYFLGENVLKVNIRLTNNSSDIYKLSNFFLRDSQGKEYTTSFIDLNEDIFKSFPPNETKTATLNFYVDYPKASHWLVLKDKNFNKEIDSWKLEI